MRRRRRLVVFALTAALVYVADVVTKVVAVAFLEDEPPIELLGGLLTLTFLRNPGAAFGLAQGYTVILALASLVVVGVVIHLARRITSIGWALALGLLFGGALGNLSDRIFREPGPLRGHVVDFLELPNWPVFNVADSGITCAAALIIVLTLRGTPIDAPSHESSERTGDESDAQTDDEADGRTGDEAVVDDVVADEAAVDDVVADDVGGNHTSDERREG